jgi:hypothetical protein
MNALVISGGFWLAAACGLYSYAPSFLTLPHAHFRRLRFAIGTIVIPGVAVASVFLITGNTLLACAVGFPAAAVLWLGASCLLPLMLADEVLSAGEREERERDAPPFTPQAVGWVGLVIGLAVSTYAVVLAIR